MGKRGRIGAKLIYDQQEGKIKMETVYIAGGCLWGVQHFFDTVPGVQMTEAGRANGTTSSLDGPYDGYAECATEIIFLISELQILPRTNRLKLFTEIRLSRPVSDSFPFSDLRPFS